MSLDPSDIRAIVPLTALICTTSVAIMFIWQSRFWHKFMLEVEVSNATLDPRCRRCEVCKRLYDVETRACPVCKARYETLVPWWDSQLRLTPTADEYHRNYRRTFRLSGPTMDTVMGMTIQDYLRLCEEYGDLEPLVIKYFTRNKFMMRRSTDRVLSISLMPGNQLTFKNWLGLQPSFDHREIMRVIMDNIEIDMEEAEGDWMEELDGAEEMKVLLEKGLQ